MNVETKNGVHISVPPCRTETKTEVRERKWSKTCIQASLTVSLFKKKRFLSQFHRGLPHVFFGRFVLIQSDFLRSHSVWDVREIIHRHQS